MTVGFGLVGHDFGTAALVCFIVIGCLPTPGICGAAPQLVRKGGDS